MAVQGTYEISVQTPFGEQQGFLELEVNGTSLNGRLTNPKGTFDIDEGSVTGNEVKFKAKIHTPVGRLKAEVSGSVEGDHFRGVARLPLGEAKIEGVRR